MGSNCTDMILALLSMWFENFGIHLNFHTTCWCKKTHDYLNQQPTAVFPITSCYNQYKISYFPAQMCLKN